MSKNAPTTIEKFVATRLGDRPEDGYARPAIFQAQPAEESDTARAEIHSRKSFGGVGRALLVFVCGVLVGYLLSVQAELSPLQARHIEPAAFTPTGLRIDYDLRHY